MTSAPLSQSEAAAAGPVTQPTGTGAIAGDQVRLPETASVTLDLVRAVSAQAVVVGHAAIFFSVLSILRPPRMPYVQNIGVVVFFLLSGYLISYTVFRKSHDRTYTFRIFTIERFARIFSGFIPGLLFILAIDLLTVAVNPQAYRHAGELRADVFASNLLMLQDESLGQWIAGALSAPKEISAVMIPFGSARPLWTIAIEWWIYLAFGWVTLVIRRDPRSPRGWMMAGVFAVIPLYNLIDGRGHSLTLTWLLGAGAFWLGLRSPTTWSTAGSTGAAILCAAAASLRALHTGEAYDTTFAALLALSLYFVIAACRTTRYRWHRQATRIVRFAAGYSMTLYIVHYSVLSAVAALGGTERRWPSFLAAIALANICAIALAIPFEMRHRSFARWLLVRLPSSGSRGRSDGRPIASTADSR